MNPDISALPLRDIHLPDAVSWWPLAPGWWIVIALLLLLSLSVVLWRYLRKQGQLRRDASLELKQIVAEYKKRDNARQLINQLSMLLRRLCVSAHPHYASAGLTGVAWLQFLDEIHRKKNKPKIRRFSTPSGELLITVPYNNSKKISQNDVNALIAMCQDWVRALPSGNQLNQPHSPHNHQRQLNQPQTSHARQSTC